MDLEAPISALGTSAASAVSVVLVALVVSARYLECQAVLLDQALELPSLGLTQVLQAAALLKWAHQLSQEALRVVPAIYGVPHKPSTTKDSQVMVLPIILAKAMTPTVQVTVSIPLDTDMVTALEAKVSLVLLHLALRDLWRREVDPQALLARPAPAEVPQVEGLLRLRGLK